MNRERSAKVLTRGEAATKGFKGWIGCLAAAVLMIAAVPSDAPGTVKAHQKISDLQGGFTGILDNGDHFGIAVTNLGDLDGDGVVDLAVGAFNDDDGGNDPGEVWILFLDDDGSVN